MTAEEEEMGSDIKKKRLEGRRTLQNLQGYTQRCIQEVNHSRAERGGA